MGWTQTDLAERTGLTQHAVYQIELAMVTARNSTVAEIEAAFEKAGISFDDLADHGFRVNVPNRVLSRNLLRTK